MEEIIPYIEQSWREMASEESIRTTTIIVEDVLPGDIFKAALSASKIVVTAFNTHIAQALVSLRSRYYVDTPFIFYLHGFASVACWPMKKWGVLDVWSEQDIFISSAKRDLDLFNISIKTNNAFVVPFALLDEIKIDETQKINTNHISFYYVGRISEQKNLHSLFWALAIYLKKSQNRNISLDVFGSEDNLGSPNMGRRSGPYLQILLELVHELGLNDFVKFHGFTERNKIVDKIQVGRRVFISTSLHADENFGMAALRALSMGHSAILSDWGGHSDYLDTFKEKVHLVGVQVSKTGPFLEIPELVKKIEKLTKDHNAESVNLKPSYYQFSSIKEQLKLIFNHQDLSSIQYSEYIDILVKRWDQNKDESQSSKVFGSFEDEIFHRFSMAYAGRDNYYIDASKGELMMAPWVASAEDKIVIEDPHRGTKELVGLTVSDKEKWLTENGYAFTPLDF